MILLDIIMALIVAMILSVIFALSTWRESRKSGLIWLFLILFLATWAGGIWLRPFGPKLWGLHWLSFLFIGFIVARNVSWLRPITFRARLAGKVVTALQLLILVAVLIRPELVPVLVPVIGVIAVIAVIDYTLLLWRERVRMPS